MKSSGTSFFTQKPIKGSTHSAAAVAGPPTRSRGWPKRVNVRKRNAWRLNGVCASKTNDWRRHDTSVRRENERSPNGTAMRRRSAGRG